MKKIFKRIDFRKLFYITVSLLIAFIFSFSVIKIFDQATNQVLNSKYLASYFPQEKEKLIYEYVQCELEDGYSILERSICEQIHEKIYKEIVIESSFEQTIEAEKAGAYVEEVDDEYEWGKTYKKDDLISVSKFGADEAMSTVDELNLAMNLYRERKGLSTLNHDQQICDFAQTRAQQNFDLGELDRHEGFEPLFNEQELFFEMGEVIFGGGQPVSGVHIVEWGWDQSLTGHKEAISDPKWSDGCAGIAGYFAVYVFGRR